MNYSSFVFLLGIIFLTCSANSGKQASNSDNLNLQQMATDKLKITIGSNTYSVILYNNKTTAALKTMLPLTLVMKELNNNEKYADLPSNLPTQTENIGIIQNGDLLLWGANTLVVFYKTFRTSYSYTKIGRIENPDDLEIVLGSGKVMVIFELE